jgi:hypothetical protein
MNQPRSTSRSHRAAAVLMLEVVGVALVPSRLDLPQAVAVLLAVYSAALYSDRRPIVVALLVVA